MRRYWFSIALLLFSITGVGLNFIIYGLEQLPEYKLETIEGDKQWGENVSLSGSYNGRIRHQQVSVSYLGSKYEQDRSMTDWIWNKLTDYPYSWLPYHDLVREHRNFMRDKMKTGGLDYDEEWIIYSSVESIDNGFSKKKWAIITEMLNLKSGKVTRHQTNLSEQNEWIWSYVVDVERIGEEIHLLIGVEGGFKHYVAAMNSGDILRIADVSPNVQLRDGAKLGMSFLSKSDKPSSDIVVFRVNDQLEAENGFSSISYLMSYSYPLGRTIDLIEVDREETKYNTKIFNHTSYNYQNDRMIGLKYNENQLSIASYELSADSIIQTGASVIPVDQLGKGSIRYANCLDDRIYVLLTNEDAPQFVVFDINKGMIKNRSEVVVDGSVSDAKEELKHLQLSSIMLQR